MKVSFDFDGVLTTDRGKRMLIDYQKKGDSIFIVTARPIAWKKKVLKFADVYGIPVTRVIFTTLHHKWEVIKRRGIDLHIDNNPDELKLIRENTNAKTKLF